MNIEKATARDGALDLVIDGVEASIIEPSLYMLARGFVVVDGAPFKATLPADPPYGIPEPREIEGLTDDPVLVELGKRVWAGQYIADGAIEMPTREQALAARWELDLKNGGLRKLS